MHFNWQKFSGVSELLSFPPQFFFVKNLKIAFFAEKGVLNIFFIELKCRLLQTSLADLEKTLNICIFSQGRFFYAFLKISHFSTFLKITSSTC